MNKNQDLYFKTKKEQKKQKEYNKRLRAFRALSLDDKLKFIRQYNTEHNTNYSYGKFIAAVDSGNIEV